VKPVGGGISELRINYGPGYRVYYMTRGKALLSGEGSRVASQGVFGAY